MSKKRPMTKQEKSYIDAAVNGGCIIEGCGQPAEWHHLPTSRGANAHCIGYSLCPEHHRGMEFPGQSVHGSRMLFTSKYGTELELLQKQILRVINKTI